MKNTRKAAKQRLRDATPKELEVLLQTVKLTPTQCDIVRLHFGNGYSQEKIARELYWCRDTIRYQLAKIYDKVAQI